MESEAVVSSSTIKTRKPRKPWFRKRCKACPELKFKNQDEYDRHVNDQHNGKVTVYNLCSDCGKQFRNRGELNAHINSKCGTVKLFKCKICQQELMTAGSLHNHMLRHTGDKQYVCSYCAKRVLTAGQLKVHERSHTSDKAFVCEVCGKGFCHRQSLITHSTLHTGIKPFQCENCCSSFSCIGNLLKHRKSRANTCGLIPLTTHRVKHLETKLKVKMNTPANTRLKPKKEVKQQEEEKIEEVVETEEETVVSDNDFIYCDETDNNQPIQEENSDQPIIIWTIQENEFTLENSDLVGQTVNYVEESAVAMETTETDDDPLNLSEFLDFSRHKKLKETDGENLEENATTTSDTKENESRLCKFCQKPYSTLKSLKQHEKSHKNETTLFSERTKTKKQFKCTFCKSAFDTKNECTAHQHKEHANSLTCFECDKIFANVDSLRSHHKTVHKGHRRKLYSYVCDKCGHLFRQRSVLQQHVDSNCGTGPQFQCHVCERYFATVHSRRLHMKVHDPEKKLQCKYCGKTFRWKGQLKIHERSHTGEKPFSCLYCPKTFAYRESLLTHSTLHTGIKPYLCEACGSRFSCMGNLIKHKITHASTCGVWYEKQKGG